MQAIDDFQLVDPETPELSDSLEDIFAMKE